MNVKEAVQIATNYVREVFSQEQVSNLGLEEVVFDEDEGHWKITVGFSRHWDYPRQTADNVWDLVKPEKRKVFPRREYKIVAVDDNDGKVKSVAIRDIGE